MFTVAHGVLCVPVDRRIYGQDTLLKAVHRFTDRCYLHLQYHDDHIVEAHFEAKPGCNVSLENLAGEFCNELLDQRLRSLVQLESEPVRNLILAHALSRTSLIAAELETSEPVSEPGSPHSSDLQPLPQGSTQLV